MLTLRCPTPPVSVGSNGAADAHRAFSVHCWASNRVGPAPVQVKILSLHQAEHPLSRRRLEPCGRRYESQKVPWQGNLASREAGQKIRHEQPCMGGGLDLPIGVDTMRTASMPMDVRVDGGLVHPTKSVRA